MYIARVQGIRLRGRGEAGHLDDDSDQDAEDGDSDNQSIEEEINVETPLDSVDPWIRFKAVLTSTSNGSKATPSGTYIYSIADLQMANPAGYQAATTALNPEQQARLMEVMAVAQKAEEKAAAQGSA
jgi:hypothetical protein